MYPLNLRTKCSRTTYTFTWVIEDKNDLMPQSQSGPTFEVKGEKWHLELHKFSSQYRFRLYRRVSGSDVLVNATIKVVNAKGHLMCETMKQLNYEKSDATDANFDLLACEDDIRDGYVTEVESWRDLGEDDQYPNKIKFKLNLEFCVLVTSVEGSSTDDELQKQAQISLAKATLAMLDNQTNLDITLSIRSDRIRGHKLILAARCPELAEMFLREPRRTVIEINHKPFGEVSPETMKMLFEFIYTRVRYDYSDIKYKGEKPAYLTLFSLYHAAYSFKMKELKKLVGILFLREVTPARIGDLLDLSEDYSDNMLKPVALQFIKDHFKACCRENFLKRTGGEDSPLYKQIIRKFA